MYLIPAVAVSCKNCRFWAAILSYLSCKSYFPYFSYKSYSSPCQDSDVKEQTARWPRDWEHESCGPRIGCKSRKGEAAGKTTEAANESNRSVPNWELRCGSPILRKDAAQLIPVG